MLMGRSKVRLVATIPHTHICGPEQSPVGARELLIELKFLTVSAPGNLSHSTPPHWYGD